MVRKANFKALCSFFLAALGSLIPGVALAEIVVGVTLSATGPAASLGIPEKNTIALMPSNVAGHKVTYIVLDDASDSTKAVTNVRKLVTEHKVDLIIGSTTSPSSLAMVDVAAESETPMISLGASARIIEPQDTKRRWVFKTPQNDIMMALAIAEHMSNNGVKTVGFIGFADAYGEGWNTEFGKAAQLKRLEVLSSERYNRSDTSIEGQILRILSRRPDAVLVAASGTPAVLPQRMLKERGYTGVIYQTHGVANSDFLRLGGKDVEGTVLPAGPVLVASQLPVTNLLRNVGILYVTKYEAAYGKGSASTFGAHAWDAGLLMQTAAHKAVRAATPGTKEFRAALRDALESVKEMPGAHGVFSMSATDHVGLDQRARVMVKIDKGTWKYQP